MSHLSTTQPVSPPPATQQRPPQAHHGAAEAKLLLLAKNSLANLLRLGTSWLIVLVVPPLLVRLLDHSSYATWMLVLQIGAYATIFDGGLQLAIGRFVARADRADDPDYLGKVLSSATALLVFVAITVCVLVVCAALNLGNLFRSIPREIVPQARIALLLVGGSLSIAMSTSAFAGLCLGLEKNEINAVAAGVSKLIGACGTLWAAFHHQGLVWMAAWTAAGTLMQPLMFFLAAKFVGAARHFKLHLISARMAEHFFRFCAATFASQFSGVIISGLDLPIIAAFDFHNAGYYAVAITASGLLVVPYCAVLSTLVPMMSSLSAGEEASRMGQVMLRTTRLALALLMLAAVPLTLGMPVLLHFWVGIDYASHTLVFAETLMIAQLVRLTLTPYAIIGFSAGEQGHMLVSPIGEAAVNLACSLVLVRNMGAEGVAIGTLIGAFVGVALHFFVSMPHTRSSMAFSRKNLLWRGIIRPVGWAVVPAIALAIGMRLFTAPAAQILLLCAAVVALAAIFWFWHLDPGERILIRGATARLLPSRLRTTTTGA